MQHNIIYIGTLPYSIIQATTLLAPPTNPKHNLETNLEIHTAPDSVVHLYYSLYTQTQQWLVNASLYPVNSHWCGDVGSRYHGYGHVTWNSCTHYMSAWYPLDGSCPGLGSGWGQWKQ